MKDKQYWKNWLLAAGVRAIKTAAQTAVSTIGVTAAVPELGGVNWKLVASVSLCAAIVSLLTSLGGLPEVPLTDVKEGN